MGQLNAELDYESALETAEKLVESDTTGFAKFDVAVLKDRKGEADEALRLLDEVIAASVPASIPALDAKLSVLTRQNRGLSLKAISGKIGRIRSKQFLMRQYWDVSYSTKVSWKKSLSSA